MRTLKHNRSSGLIAIVIYKSCVAFLSLVTSIALFFAFNNYQEIVDFAHPYILEGKRGIIVWLLKQFLNLDDKTLKVSSLISALYGAVTIIEAVGLWQEKQWAHILVVGLVSISIPPEIYELVREISWLHALVFLINIAVLIYLIKNFPKHQSKF